MKRRTILAALAAAPFVALTSIAQARGFRKRQRCESTPLAVAYVSRKSVGLPLLELTPAMGGFDVKVTVQITLEFDALQTSPSDPPPHIQETVTTVTAKIRKVGTLDDMQIGEPQGASGSLTFFQPNVALEDGAKYIPVVEAVLGKTEWNYGVPKP